MLKSNKYLCGNEASLGERYNKTFVRQGPKGTMKKCSRQGPDA